MYGYTVHYSLSLCLVKTNSNCLFSLLRAQRNSSIHSLFSQNVLNILNLYMIFFFHSKGAAVCNILKCISDINERHNTPRENKT